MLTPSDGPPRAEPPAPRGLSPRRWPSAIPVLVGVGLALLLGAIALQLRRASPPRLAVLPFATSDTTGTLPEWGSAVADELTSLLSRQDPARLAVVARTSAAYYADRLVPVDQISRELDVDFVVEGTVRGEGGGMIEVRLIRAADQVPLWSGQFDGAGGPAAVVGAARAIAAELGLRMASAGEPELPADPSIHRAYLLGVHHLRQETPEGLAAALPLLAAVTTSAPGFGRGWAAHAEGRMRIGRLEDARASIDRALRINPATADAFRTRGQLHLARWDPAEALHDLDRAVALAPGDARMYHTRAYVHTLAGRFGDAFQDMTVARRLDPASAAVHADLGFLYFAAGRWVEGLAQCEEAARYGRSGTLIPVDRCRVAGWTGAGMVDSAQGGIRRLLEAAGEPWTIAGEAEMTMARLWTWVATDEPRLLAVLGGAGPYAQARAWAAGGNADQALAALHEALAEQSPALLRVATEPMLAALRGDPRLVALMVKVVPAADGSFKAGGEPGCRVFNTGQATQSGRHGLEPCARPPHRSLNLT